MKKVIFVVILLAVGYFGTNLAVHKTSDAAFCVSCHEWMDTSVNAYKMGSHAGVECTTCHLPQDSAKLAYLLKKAANGVSEVTHMLTHDAKDMDWQANRARRAEYVYDSGCISCHAKVLGAEHGENKNAADMHAAYVSSNGLSGEIGGVKIVFLGENSSSENGKKLACVSCHKSVGHESLGKILHDVKHPPVGKWSDEDRRY
ncbi:NapC/NirT family cytochrome c [Campylobacter sp. 19-13652]|uniref:cytochrome c3 family protein n=1 Tax=Campylobacter sp. 19-13652 TaxID=2840180 RepID=UPI001C767F95|nr:NapC/NirT family cytochrome c [Campylobacter sp. 19-13652]BCX78764.1 hypothetical protein LBC_02260 [Campylobacter sp. 19-13652]